MTPTQEATPLTAERVDQLKSLCQKGTTDERLALADALNLNSHTIRELMSALKTAEAKVAATLDELAALRANQRTPGTLEICQHYRSANCGENEDYANMGACGRKSCPIRPQKQPQEQE